MSETTSIVEGRPQPRLLDALRETARQHGPCQRTVATFAAWVTTFVRFHSRRHPRELHLAEVGRFLRHVQAS
jgi:hypothetical protein